MRSFVLALALCGSLTGCLNLPDQETIRYVDAAYGKVVYQDYQNDVDTWRISDKPAEGKMYITTSLDAAERVGKIHGASFGLAKGTPKQETFQTAAEGFLKKSGRKCEVVSGQEMTLVSYEFEYKCKK